MCCKQDDKGKQYTIIWHVDNLKISHVGKNVILDKKFGQVSPLVTTQGKILEYLSKTIDHTIKGNEKYTCMNT